MGNLIGASNNGVVAEPQPELKGWIESSLRRALGNPSPSRLKLIVEFEDRGTLDRESEYFTDLTMGTDSDGAKGVKYLSFTVRVEASRRGSHLWAKVSLEWERHYDWQPLECHIIEEWAREASMIAEAPLEFVPSLRASIMERVIPRVMARRILVESNENGAELSVISETIRSVLDFAKSSASSTYEGSDVRLSVLVDSGMGGDDEGRMVRWSDYADRDANPWCVLLGASSSTCLRVSGDGVVRSVKAGQPELRRDEDPPEYFIPLPDSLSVPAAASKELNAVLISTLPNGAVIIGYAGSLVFSYRSGGWNFYSEDLIRMGWNYVNWRDGVKAAVMEALIDASFAGQGACIGVVKAPGRSPSGGDDNIKMRMGQSRAACWPGLKDVLTSQQEEFSGTAGRYWGPFVGEGDQEDFRAALIRADGSHDILFHKLSREQRLELMSMDGATLVCGLTGHVLAAGVIVQRLDGSGRGGGRSAAARTLARFGSSFKVSQDGQVTMWSRADPESFSLDDVPSWSPDGVEVAEAVRYG